MRLSALFRRLDQVQKSLWFKWIATGVMVALAVGATGWYAVDRAASRTWAQVAENPAEAGAGAAATPEEQAARQAEKSAVEETVKMLNRVGARESDWTDVAVGAGLGLGLSLCVIWLGLGLTAVGLLVVVEFVAGPLWLMGDRRLWVVGIEGRSLALFIDGAAALAFSFTVLVEVARLALSGPWAVTAIARNVVNEAVRLKVSLVFVILLIFALAALPGLLHEGTPLRYRVQSFLQYGTGGSFLIIALMVLFLAVGSVAFEQRDRVIWQTMTKPVAAWQYLLGKWLGVSAMGAVLLAVSASGVFLFTTYLAEQKAIGEAAPHLPRGASEDRWILQNQVLAARTRVRVAIPPVDNEALDRAVEERVTLAKRADANYQDTPAERDNITNELLTQARQQFLSIEPGGIKPYVFQGLQRARERAEPLVVRYRIDVGSNDPRVTYRLTFHVPDAPPRVVSAPLGQTLTLDGIYPTAIDDQGQLQLDVANGDVERGILNAETITFPPDGLEVFYSVGSFRMNFLRVMVVLWLKLAFLAAVGIWAATFLSFPVASLVSFGVFVVAEGAGYLSDSLDYYDATDTKGNLIWYRLISRLIGLPISRGFRFYSNLRPTQNLVDGVVVSWGTVVWAVVVLGVVTAAMYGIGVWVFRRRELATYSGH